MTTFFLIFSKNYKKYSLDVINDLHLVWKESVLGNKRTRRAIAQTEPLLFPTLTINDGMADLSRVYQPKPSNVVWLHHLVGKKFVLLGNRGPTWDGAFNCILFSLKGIYVTLLYFTNIYCHNYPISTYCFEF